MLNELKACVSVHGRIGLSEVEPGLRLSELGLDYDSSSELSGIVVSEFLADIESYTGVTISLEEYSKFGTVADVSRYLNSAYLKPSSTSTEESLTLTNEDDQ